MMFEQQMQYMSESIVYVKFSKRECRSEKSCCANNVSYEITVLLF